MTARARRLSPGRGADHGGGGRGRSAMERYPAVRIAADLSAPPRVPAAIVPSAPRGSSWSRDVPSCGHVPVFIRGALGGGERRHCRGLEALDGEGEAGREFPRGDRSAGSRAAGAARSVTGRSCRCPRLGPSACASVTPSLWRESMDSVLDRVAGLARRRRAPLREHSATSPRTSTSPCSRGPWSSRPRAPDGAAPLRRCRGLHHPVRGVPAVQPQAARHRTSHRRWREAVGLRAASGAPH